MQHVAIVVHPDAQRRSARATSGFTLIELLVAIAVLAIMIALAVPSFTGLINGNRLTANSNEMVASLQLAKMESLRRNLRVAVCESDDGATCTDGDEWGQWITIADSNRDGTYDQVLRVSVVEQPVQVRAADTITGNGNRIEFRADGMARAADGALLDALVSVCLPTTQPPQNERLVELAFGSRINSRRSDAGGACVAP
ncbi:GspH/FimT family pseudopilin [Lysobacter sp. A3-1-A15]|uniref:GspH/FimT family pseudopilin n=1 Tax=Novilysobacter viscosus TaxID=3098602 RepID=UPI002ED97E37